MGAGALGRLRGLALALALGVLSAGAPARPAASPPTVPLAELPTEARATLVLIKRGGPFPYRKDGSTFGNYEQRLPRQYHGYYREYTVPTPGERSRGARRIVAGESLIRNGERRGEYYYTADHYRSFRQIAE